MKLIVMMMVLNLGLLGFFAFGEEGSYWEPSQKYLKLKKVRKVPIKRKILSSQKKEISPFDDWGGDDDLLDHDEVETRSHRRRRRRRTSRRYSSRDRSSEPVYYHPKKWHGFLSTKALSGYTHEKAFKTFQSGIGYRFSLMSVESMGLLWGELGIKVSYSSVVLKPLIIQSKFLYLTLPFRTYLGVMKSELFGRPLMVYANLGLQFLIYRKTDLASLPTGTLPSPLFKNMKLLFGFTAELALSHGFHMTLILENTRLGLGLRF